jgi:DNA polymerase elongation subunit (family B)
MDYSEMTDKEKKEKIKVLEKQIQETDAKYNFFKSMQLGLKLVINGTYGAFAHPKFVVSNKHIANAITMHGRDVILFMLEHIENYFYNHWHEDVALHEILEETYIGFDKDFNCYMINKNDQIVFYPESPDEEVENKEKSSLFKLLKSWGINPERIEKAEEKKLEIDGKEITIKWKRFLHDFSNTRQIDGTPFGDRELMDGYDTKFHKEEMITYGDTDSVFKDTVIRTDDRDCTIEEFYNSNIKNGSAGETLKGHESVKTGEKVLNWSEEKGLYYAPVKRIIRHKVKKAKWKLRTKSGKEIIVTNDHSMIVFRNGNKIEVKPSEILKTDKILVVLDK